MSRRAAWGPVAALGLLAAACGGSRASHAPAASGGENRMLELAQGLGQTLRQCEALRTQVTVREEYALGGAVAINWVERGGGLMLESPEEQRMHRALNLVGQNLAAQSARPMLGWTFGVLADPHAINATSAPGGYIFVTRGLLRSVQNEAQLAGVLAHEMAHVVLKHALVHYDEVKVGQCKLAANFRFTQQLTRQAHQQLMPPEMQHLLRALEDTGFLDLDRDASLLRTLTDQLVEQLVAQGHSHEDEFAADEMALHLLASAGYEPREYVAFLGRLPEGRGFAHHPGNKQRQERLLALLEAARRPEGAFPELPADSQGLVKPPLPPELAPATR